MRSPDGSAPPAEAIAAAVGGRVVRKGSSLQLEIDPDRDRRARALTVQQLRGWAGGQTAAEGAGLRRWAADLPGRYNRLRAGINEPIGDNLAETLVRALLPPLAEAVAPLDPGVPAVFSSQPARLERALPGGLEAVAQLRRAVAGVKLPPVKPGEFLDGRPQRILTVLQGPSEPTLVLVAHRFPSGTSFLVQLFTPSGDRVIVGRVAISNALKPVAADPPSIPLSREGGAWVEILEQAGLRDAGAAGRLPTSLLGLGENLDPKRVERWLNVDEIDPHEPLVRPALDALVEGDRVVLALDDGWLRTALASLKEGRLELADLRGALERDVEFVEVGGWKVGRARHAPDLRWNSIDRPALQRWFRSVRGSRVVSDRAMLPLQRILGTSSAWRAVEPYLALLRASGTEVGDLSELLVWNTGALAELGDGQWQRLVAGDVLPWSELPGPARRLLVDSSLAAIASERGTLSEREAMGSVFLSGRQPVGLAMKVERSQVAYSPTWTAFGGGPIVADRDALDGLAADAEHRLAIPPARFVPTGRWRPGQRLVYRLRLYWSEDVVRTWTWPGTPAWEEAGPVPFGDLPEPVRRALRGG